MLLLQLAPASKLYKPIANMIGQPMERSHTIFEGTCFIQPLDFIKVWHGLINACLMEISPEEV
jgi:hypothetical protein